MDGDARSVSVITRALQKVVEEHSPAIVLGAASAIGRDSFALLVTTKAWSGVEIAEMSIQDMANLVAIRPQFSGKHFFQVQISTECKRLQSVLATSCQRQKFPRSGRVDVDLEVQ